MPEKVKKGWTRVAFGDVVRQVRDRVAPEQTDLERYVAGEHMDTDDLKIRRWGLIGDGYLGPAFHMRFKPGHVLYGSRRTYLRKVAVADFEGVTANTTFVLESKDPKVLLPELLPFIMQTESFHAHSIKQSKGSVNPYINYSDLTWYEFALPPLDEQRRIAELMVAGWRASDELMGLGRAIDDVKEAWVRDLFGCKRWHPRLLGEACELIRDGTHLPPKRVDDGPLLLGVTNLIDGELQLTPADTRVSDTFYAEMHKNWELKPGDLLLAIVGATIGKTALVPEGFPKFTLQRSVAVIRGKSNVLSNEFLRMFLDSRLGQKTMWGQVHQTAQPGLYLGDLSRIPIPLPGIPEQKAICCDARRLNSTATRCVSRANEIGSMIGSMVESLFGNHGSRERGNSS